MASEHSEYEEERNELIARLKRLGYLPKSGPIYDAFVKVPRHEFVPLSERPFAYVDHPLPLWDTGATISAPHMCVLILEYLQLEAGHIVLEVGAGSGYQAALIAEMVCPSSESSLTEELCGHVYTIEIHPQLVEFARGNLERAGYADRVTVIQGDGTLGYPEAAPYDRILLTAAGNAPPPPLVEQLKVGGILCMPVDQGSYQAMMNFVKQSDGTLKKEHLTEVMFVPLRGKFGLVSKKRWFF